MCGNQSTASPQVSFPNCAFSGATHLVFCETVFYWPRTKKVGLAN